MQEARVAPPRPLLAHALDLATQAAIEEALREAGQRLVAMPATLVDHEDDVADACVFKGHYASEVYAYTLYGVPAAERPAVLGLLRNRLAACATVTDGGHVLSINAPAAHKGDAVQHFAQSLGLGVLQVLKFGDRPGPLGNDRTFLADATSFNVGFDDAVHPDVQRGALKHGAGVLEVLRLHPSAPIASDFDGTLTVDAEEEAPLHPEVATELLRRLEAGLPIAIISGRGPSLYEVLVAPLLRAGLSPQGLSHLMLYLFNGALGVRACDFVRS